MKKLWLVLMVILSACGTTAEDDVGSSAAAVTTSTQHPQTDWWRPPEWSYSPTGITLTTAMTADDINLVNVLHGTPIHCGSMRFTGFQGFLCPLYHDISVTFHGHVDVGSENVTPYYYWQQGSSAGMISTFTFVGRSPPRHADLSWTAPDNFVLSRNWAPADFGCGTSPPQGAIFGLCFAGTATLDTTVSDFWVDLTYSK